MVGESEATDRLGYLHFSRESPTGGVVIWVNLPSGTTYALLSWVEGTYLLSLRVTRNTLNGTSFECGNNT